MVKPSNSHLYSTRNIVFISIVFISTLLDVIRLYSYPAEKVCGYQPSYEKALNSLRNRVHKQHQKSLFKITNSVDDSSLYRVISKDYKHAQQKQNSMTTKDAINPVTSNIDLIDAYQSQSIAEALNPPLVAFNHICSNDHYFIDNDFWYLNMPPHLEGTMSLKTAYKYNEKISDSLMTLDVNQDITIVVGWDEQIPELPKWLKQWQCLNFAMNDNQGKSYELYFRHFPEGGIILGGNMRNSDEIVYILLNDPGSRFKPFIASSQTNDSSPNPFQILHKSAQVKYTLTKTGPVTIEVVDSSNQLVKTIKRSRDELAGEHYEPFWNGLNDLNETVSTGIYLLRVSTGTRLNTIKIALLN